jgi:hypothetical protein
VKVDPVLANVSDLQIPNNEPVGAIGLEPDVFLEVLKRCPLRVVI